MGREFVVEPDVTEEYRKRQKGAARMINADESRVRDDVEGLLAAIVGMRAPTDVGQQTSGVTESLFFRSLVQAGRGHEAVGPGDELLAMPRGTRAQQVELLRGSDQRVVLFLLRLEH